MTRITTRQKVLSKGRRGFIKALAALGVSRMTLSLLTKDALADMDVNLDKEIPYVARVGHPGSTANEPSGPREPQFETIPRSKWERVEAAYMAAHALDIRINSTWDNSRDLITVGVTSLEEGPSAEKAVRVRRIEKKEDPVLTKEGEVEGYDTEIAPNVSLEQLERNLPSRIEGTPSSETIGNNVQTPNLSNTDTYDFPVIFEERVERNGSCKTWWYDSDHDHNIPGGSKFRNGAGVGQGTATLGTPAYSQNLGERVMVTAGHALDDVTSIYQPGSPYALYPHSDGSVSQWRDNSTGDFGTVKSPPNHQGTNLYKYRLADDNGGFKSDTYINGIINWSSIKYNEGDPSYTVKKQGARSGTTSGYIDGTDISRGKVVDTTCGAWNGDSGGSIFREYEYSGITDVYILGIFCWFYGNNCPGDSASGNAMEYIEDELNIQVS